MITKRLGLLFPACLALYLILNVSTSAQEEEPETLKSAFVTAARQWSVPLPVLMAIGYVETRWDQREGKAALDGGYGIMHLVAGSGGSLERASLLTGLPESALRDEAVANIQGGAAILSDISRKTGITTEEITNLSNWYSVVAEYSGTADPLVRDSYAQEVFRVIAGGEQLSTPSGEIVQLDASPLASIVPPALDAPTSEDYPSALWLPAHSNNFSLGRQYGPIKFVVIHDTEGSYTSALNWFQNPNSRVSSHYVIRSSDGQITQMVRNANTAYHAGNWDYNVRSFGIEHEGYASQPAWYTEVMYRSSADLVRSLANRYGIRKDRAHLIGHDQVPGSDHTDPGPYWNWSHYMSLVRNDSARTAFVDNSDPGFAPIPSQISAANYWYSYSGGYANSNALATHSASANQSSTNSGTWTAWLPLAGNYDVYAYIPYVNNNAPDTAAAKYHVSSSSGIKIVTVSQKAITDVGSGSWAHLGTFSFLGGEPARVTLSNLTGETGRNVWFDAMMWIPSSASASPGEPSPTPARTSTPVPTRTATPTRTTTAVATRTPTREATRTATPTRTPLLTPSPTWTPGACGLRFSDLPASDWAYTYVSDLYCRGVVSGYADGTFRPSAGTTRGQFTKMVTLGFGWNLYNPYFPFFSDVQPGSTFFTYVETAALRGIISGYEDGTFRPNTPLTRAQAAKILVLAAGWPLVYAQAQHFTDVDARHWAFPYIETAVVHNMISGYSDATFRPDLEVTRAQVAKMVDEAIR